MGCGHGADWIADSTLVGAVVGEVNRLYGHCPVVRGEAESAAGLQRPAILHPDSGADGARGLTGEVDRAFIFYQDVCRAADGGSCYQSWQKANSIHPLKTDVKCCKFILVPNTTMSHYIDFAVMTQ